jgi:hypothetical protein
VQSDRAVLIVWGRDDPPALLQLLEAARSGKLVWFDGGEYLTSTGYIANVVEGVRLCLDRGAAGKSMPSPTAMTSRFKPVITARHYVSLVPGEAHLG